MKSFHYQSCSKQLEKSIRRSLGMHLFRVRQSKRLEAKKVCNDLNLKPKILDYIEIGKGNTRWNYIQQLMEYYKVQINFDLDLRHKQ